MANVSAYPTSSHQRIKNTIVFCGNTGRLQATPLVVSAIEGYLDRGGKLSFTFLGSGAHIHLFRELSDRWNNVVCLEYLPLGVKFFQFSSNTVRSLVGFILDKGSCGAACPGIYYRSFFQYRTCELTFSTKGNDDDTLPDYLDFFFRNP